MKTQEEMQPRQSGKTYSDWEEMFHAKVQLEKEQMDAMESSVLPFVLERALKVYPKMYAEWDWERYGNSDYYRRERCAYIRGILDVLSIGKSYIEARPFVYHIDTDAIDGMSFEEWVKECWKNGDNNTDKLISDADN